MIKATVTSSAVFLFLGFSTPFSLPCSSGASLTSKVRQINKSPLFVQCSYQGGFGLHGVSMLGRDIGSQHPRLYWGTASVIGCLLPN